MGSFSVRNLIKAGALGLAMLLPAAMAASPAAAQAVRAVSPLAGLLAKASDGALDQLAKPGAFFNDSDIRVGLPTPAGQGAMGGLGGLAGKAGMLMGAADKLGLTGDLTRRLNDAAGLAARAAKPVFRTAISKMTVADVPGILASNDGGTQYLRQSAGAQLREQMRPLIVDAMGKSGAFAQLNKVMASGAALGFNRDTLTNAVTDQAMSGIFQYIAKEEGRLRANPLGAAGSLLKGITQD